MTKKLSSTAAAKYFKKLIDKAIKMGVRLRSGTYGSIETENNKKIVYACAVGSIEHAIGLGGRGGNSTIMRKIKKNGFNISEADLIAIESGFEGFWSDDTSVRRNPCWKLGKKYRAQADRRERRDEFNHASRTRT